MSNSLSLVSREALSTSLVSLFAIRHFFVIFAICLLNFRDGCSVVPRNDTSLTIARLVPYISKESCFAKRLPFLNLMMAVLLVFTFSWFLMPQLSSTSSAFFADK